MFGFSSNCRFRTRFWNSRNRGRTRSRRPCCCSERFSRTGRSAFLTPMSSSDCNRPSSSSFAACAPNSPSTYPFKPDLIGSTRKPAKRSSPFPANCPSTLPPRAQPRESTPPPTTVCTPCTPPPWREVETQFWNPSGFWHPR